MALSFWSPPFPVLGLQPCSTHLMYVGMKPRNSCVHTKQLVYTNWTIVYTNPSLCLCERQKERDSFCTQAGFELIIFLPRPLEWWDADVCHHNQLSKHCMCVCTYILRAGHGCLCMLQRPEIISSFLKVCVYCEGAHGGQKSIRSHGAGVISSCEIPDMGSGYWTPTFYKARKCSQNLSYLFSLLYLTLWGRISQWIWRLPI